MPDPVAIRRTPYIAVYWDNVLSDQRHAVEVSHSFDQIYAEASVHCPLGLPSSVGINTHVRIEGGGSFAGSAVRFTGTVAGFDENLYPTGITLKCEGKMAKAKRTKPKVATGHSLVGMTAAEAVAFMLAEAGIDP